MGRRGPVPILFFIVWCALQGHGNADRFKRSNSLATEQNATRRAPLPTQRAKSKRNPGIGGFPIMPLTGQLREGVSKRFAPHH